MGIKYFRKMGICIPKYTAARWTYSVLQNWGNYTFFRFVSVMKLVYFSDLLGFKYAYFCL